MIFLENTFSRFSFQNLKDEIKKAWNNCEIDKDRIPEVEKWVRFFADHKTRYDKVSSITHVPNYFIFEIHLREASCSFLKNLMNGEPLDRVTKNIPKGKGPWKDWESAAKDAMVYEGFHLIGESLWTIERALYCSEKMNGFGYHNVIGDHGVIELSPYVWAGTNQHDETGKYVSDGHYNPKAPERQLGTAAVLKMLEQQKLITLKYE